MPVRGNRVNKSPKNKGLISDLEKKVINLTDARLKLKEDIQKWKEWQSHYCFIFKEAYKRSLQNPPTSRASPSERSLYTQCTSALANVLVKNEKAGIEPKRVPIDFQEYLIWEQEYVFHPRHYEGKAWLSYQDWIDEWERLTEIIDNLEASPNLQYYNTVDSHDVDFYLEQWQDLKRERERLGRVLVQLVRSSKFAFLESPVGEVGVIPSPDSLGSSGFNLSPPIGSGRPRFGPALDDSQATLQEELVNEGISAIPDDYNGHGKFLVGMDSVFRKHIMYAQNWLLNISELAQRTDEQIDALRKTYNDLEPWQKESQDSLDALQTYAYSFKDDHEHEIHMKHRLAAQRRKMQMTRLEKLQEKYTAWHEILVEKNEGYDIDALDGHNIIERNTLIRRIIRYRVKQVSHFEERYDAAIIDAVTLVAKRNYLDIELEDHITATQSRYGEDQALILRQQRRSYTEWREEEFKDFYEKARGPTPEDEIEISSEPMFTAMSSLDDEENLRDIYEFKDVLNADYTRFKQLCLEAGFWAEAKEPPPLSPENVLPSQYSPMDTATEELAEYPKDGATIRAFLESPDIAPEFDNEFFRNDVETFINRCSNFLATPLTAAQREQWYVFLEYCTAVKDLFEVDDSDMVRRIDAGWGHYWRNPVAGPKRKGYNVRKPRGFNLLRNWVVSERWSLDLGDEVTFRRDVPRQALWQHFVDANLDATISFQEFKNIMKYCHGKRSLFLMTPGDNLRRINVGWPEELPRPKNYDSWFKPLLMGARTTMKIVVGTKATANELFKEFKKTETNPRIKIVSETKYNMGNNEFLENLNFAIDRNEMFRRVNIGENSSRRSLSSRNNSDLLVVIDRGWSRDTWGTPDTSLRQIRRVLSGRR